MSVVRIVTPEQAQSLLAKEGYVYLDVRSEAEFEAGHAPQALNIPLQHETDEGWTMNEDFVAVAEACLAKDQPLVVGCKAGGRSRRAAELLMEVGFQHLVDLGVGWDGKRDAFGRLQPGWSRQGLPIETGLPAGRKYGDLLARKG
jgi:rhodanese-related sulfurtransferase